MLQNAIRADFRGFTGTYVRKCEHGRVGAQMPPACGRARGGSVRGHLGCAVALDARTWHMDRWHWTHGRGTWDVGTERTGRGQERTFLAWD